MSNLRQITRGFYDAVDDGSGRLHFSLLSFGSAVPQNHFTLTGQAQWWWNHWGKTNEAWICPSAPERKPNQRPKPAVVYASYYPGAYNTAWFATSIGGPRGATWFDVGHRAGSYDINRWLGGRMF